MTSEQTTPVAPPSPATLTHADAAAELRRPFAPGAIGFRPMQAVTYQGQAYGGVQIAAFITAQSVAARLNHVCPGCWEMTFHPVPSELVPARVDDQGQVLPPERLYLTARLAITLPAAPGEAPSCAVYEDVGEMAAGSRAGLKALYSDARKRVAVAAGIGAYLYTALREVVLPVGNGPGQVAESGRGRKTTYVLGEATEALLRNGYLARMQTPPVLRDFGQILSHGEPEDGRPAGDESDGAQITAAPAPVTAPVTASTAEGVAATAPANGTPAVPTGLAGLS